MNHGGKDKSLKMNGGNTVNEQHQPHGNSNSDKSNEENSDNNNDNIGSGIIPKNSKLKKTGDGGNPGSSNNLLS